MIQNDPSTSQFTAEGLNDDSSLAQEVHDMEINVESGQTQEVEQKEKNVKTSLKQEEQDTVKDNDVGKLETSQSASKPIADDSLAEKHAEWGRTRNCKSIEKLFQGLSRDWVVWSH